MHQLVVSSKQNERTVLTFGATFQQKYPFIGKKKKKKKKKKKNAPFLVSIVLTFNGKILQNSI